MHDAGGEDTTNKIQSVPDDIRAELRSEAVSRFDKIEVLTAVAMKKSVVTERLIR
jgi:hypothetical protein